MYIRKLKILFVFFLLILGSFNTTAQNSNDEGRAKLFHSISSKLIFIGDANKLTYIVATYGCSDDFVKILKRSKSILSSQKYEYIKYDPASPNVDFDILFVDENKNSELVTIYNKLLNASANQGASVVLFTNNWTDTSRITFNIVVQQNSDLVNFEYNLETLNKFNVNVSQEIYDMNGIDIGARQQLDKAKLELQNAQRELTQVTANLQQQQQKVDQQIQQLKDQKAIIDKTQEQIALQRSNLQNLNAEMYVAKQDLIRQQQRFAQKQAELRKKEQDIEEFQQKIDQMQERFVEQTAIIDQKTAELDQKTAEIDEVSAQIDAKKKELGNLTNIIRLQRYALMVFAFLMIIIIILAIWNFRNYRKMRKQNVVLEHQKNEIAAQAEELEKANLELEKLSIVASQTSNAVSILGKNGKFEWINAGFTKLYGYTLQLLKQELDEDIEKNPVYKGIVETFEKAVSEKESYYFEHEAITRAKKKIWVQTAITPIIGYEGELKQVVLIDSDISVIKEAEQQIAKKNKDIRNSILYASRIQKATLPSTRILLSYLPDSFILFLPRDIVSGDFYWSSKIGNKVFFAAADCTGHGVPGAFMSMLGITLLNETVSKLTGGEMYPNIVLNNLREKLIHALRQSEEESSNNDGIAISLCMVEKGSDVLHFSGAENEMILVRKGEVIDYHADDMLISKPVKEMKSFTNNEIKYQKDDMIYLFSDGYVDQFGGHGARRKKFLIKRLRDLFAEINEKSTGEQKDILLETHLDWKGKNKQLDDVIIMGVRL